MLMLELVPFRPLFGGFWINGESVPVVSVRLVLLRRRVVRNALGWVRSARSGCEK